MGAGSGKLPGSSGKFNPARDIYRIAASRIRDNRTYRIAEMVSWSLLACYLALVTYQRVPQEIHIIAMQATSVLFLFPTPFVLGAWIATVHFRGDTDEDTLRATPMEAPDIVRPRMKAVMISWVRVFMPLVALFMIANDIAYSIYFPGFFERWVRAAAAWLLVFPYRMPLRLETELNAVNATSDGMFPTPALLQIHPMLQFAIIVLCALMFISYVTFPTAWGFFWRGRLKRSSMYPVVYFLYALFPLAIIVTNYFRVRTSHAGHVFPLNERGLDEYNRYVEYVPFFNGGMTDWMWFILFGLIGVILSFVLYERAKMEWRRERV